MSEERMVKKVIRRILASSLNARISLSNRHFTRTPTCPTRRQHQPEDAGWADHRNPADPDARGAGLPGSGISAGLAGKRKASWTTVTGGDDMDFDSSSSVKVHRTYQVYRGMSPTTSNRLECSKSSHLISLPPITSTILFGEMKSPAVLNQSVFASRQLNWVYTYERTVDDPESRQAGRHRAAVAPNHF
ncbi:hypothetical protein LSH36_922g02031 [Paralvinella palmiformis]|uniref:Uncharacterized protein n=1 Tax=Paralvinella palmiformis TaxID=53620 RepID=A0AAD9IY51_9ANNE|nr:hypothetical protein LSH36_922g02031 [Paralvinella palmiformis]